MFTLAIIAPDPKTVTDANPFGNLCRTSGEVIEYMGETFKVERREIATFTNAKGYRVVYVWEVLSGPAKGQYGGKCARKSEAAKWARHAIREIGPEFERQAAEYAAAQTNA